MPQLTTALLNESIDIERLSGTETLDDRGNTSTAFSSSSSNVQARVVFSGDTTEENTDGLLQNLITLRITIPAVTDVTTKDRILYDSKKWNIVGVKNVKDRFGNSFYKQLIVQSGY
jgi:head-tail adaptor